MPNPFVETDDDDSDDLELVRQAQSGDRDALEEARAWYESPAYQEAVQHRLRGAVYRGLIVEGV